ncbi:hypothetical protein GCM10027184_77230 [Saccharothrix stipae]
MLDPENKARAGRAVEYIPIPPAATPRGAGPAAARCIRRRFHPMDDRSGPRYRRQDRRNPYE